LMEVFQVMFSDRTCNEQDLNVPPWAMNRQANTGRYMSMTHSLPDTQRMRSLGYCDVRGVPGSIEGMGASSG